MKTTDYDMINEFAIIHFPSNTVSKNRQGEGLGDEKEKIAQQDSEKKTLLLFTYTNLFSVFLKRSPWEGLGKDIGQLVLRFHKQYLDESVFVHFSNKMITVVDMFCPWMEFRVAN
jgi:hypothetical protein